MNKLLKDLARFPLCLSMRLRLKNHGFSLIAMNCIGGILYHDCHEPFLSPTINCSMTFPDYVTFCGDLKTHLSRSVELVEYDAAGGYPICRIEGTSLLIRAVHYATFEAFREAWDRRRVRVRYDKIYLMACEREGADEQWIKAFSQLPYPKVCYTARPYPYECCVLVPDYTDESGHLKDVTRYKGFWKKRIFEYYFDCVGWLNR